MSADRPSIPQRLVAFFRANPHEELTVEDIAAKFDCSLATAQNAVSVARESISLERVTIYRLGGTAA